MASGHLERLNQFTQDIEFLLISVVQGVALAALATSAAKPIGDFQLEYWLYIISAFLIILVFWSQAIIHALSFVEWPLDLTHSFLYFLASFFEVIAFSELTNPLRWFGFTFAFFCVVGVLYIVDLRLIGKNKSKFQSPDRKKLYSDILDGQRLELKALIPAGILFNAVAFLLIYFYPVVFLSHGYHIIFGIIQVVVSALAIIRSIRSFKRRARLISESE